MSEYLDGGGVRSYSSILIIRALMDQIRFLSGSGDDVQREVPQVIELYLLLLLTIPTNRAYGE